MKPVPLRPAKTTVLDNQLPIMPIVKYHIGIDPDLQKNGFSVWNVEEKRLIACQTLDFFDTLKTGCAFDRQLTIIHMSAGWLNDTVNFHEPSLWQKMPKRLKEASYAAQQNYINRIKNKVSVDVGQNHAIGKALVQVFERTGYKVILHRPNESKWSADFFTLQTGIKTKDQEKIDSGQLVFQIQ